MAYASKPFRNNVMCMLIVSSMMDGMLEQKPNGIQGHETEMKHIRTRLLTLADKFMQQMDKVHQKQMQDLARNKKNEMEVRLHFGGVPNEYVYVNKQVLDRLTANALSECGACTPDDEFAKKCQTRKDLLAAGVDARSEDGVCPFSMW